MEASIDIFDASTPPGQDVKDIGQCKRSSDYHFPGKLREIYLNVFYMASHFSLMIIIFLPLENETPEFIH